jgi:cytoskeletal protein RodZ
MSLINDALRRARQTQQQSPPATRQPLVPVEPKPRGISRMLPLAVGVLFAAACFFFGLSLARRTPPPVAVAPLPPPKQSDKPVPAPAPVPVAPAPLPEPKVTPATKPASKPRLSVTTANPIVVAPLPPKTVASAAPTAPAAPAAPAKVAAPAATPPAVPKPPVTPPPPPPPDPKLQGIFFNPTRPWAIVSGKTVYAGDRVGDFRVKEISKNTVTLEKADKTLKVLEMGR